MVYDNENKESHSNLSNNNNNNPGVSFDKLIIPHGYVYSEFLKAWIDSIKLTQTIYEQLI